MNLPLYSGADTHARLASTGHLGLWFEKFCNTWEKTGLDWSLKASDREERQSPKAKWVSALVGTSTRDKGLFGHFSQRRIALVEAKQGSWRVFQTTASLVSGTGRSHPLEIGFTWHPTLPAPYLPGSSVKGMIRAWATAEGADPGVVDRLLGSPGQIGAVCFMDALPTESVTLKADVITTHFGNWTPDNPPGDWCSPTPIPFLVTAPQTPFLFSWIAKVPLSEAENQQIATWLEEALTWAGAGAKTAVGYGRMARHLSDENKRRKERDDQRTELAEAQRRAAMDPFDRELEDLARDNASDPCVVLYQHLKAGRWREQPAWEYRVLRRLRDTWQSTGRWKPSGVSDMPPPAPGKGMKKKKAGKTKKTKKGNKHQDRVDDVYAQLQNHPGCCQASD